MAWLVDSHCHLDLNQFDADRDRVIARALDAGIHIIVVPGIDLDHSRQAIALSDAHEPVFAAVGIHPNHAHQVDATTLSMLRELAQHEKVVAIGEIGLDYHWDTVPAVTQKQAFAAQLDLAAELGLPAIIHSREANHDVAGILADWTGSQTYRDSALAKRPYAGVLHAFSGDVALAEAAYGWNFVLSLGGPVTFRNARDLQERVRHLRLDRLMLETDAPYLTPHPYRGQRNEPAYVTLVCEKLAALYAMTPQEIAETTSTVALRFFGLEEDGRAGHAFRHKIADAGRL